jgi:hypothetical protein
MGKRRRPKEPLPPEFFERALEEEMSLSAGFDLPLTLLVVRTKHELDPETTRRLLDVLRTAEFATLPNPSELAVILPDADVGLAISEPDDEVPGLLERARAARSF